MNDASFPVGRLLAHFERVADAPDAIPRLRRFILDLAVRGKLVPQDPTDEPAVVLLKRIAAERARLVKIGQIRRQKPLAPIDEAPFALPPSWCWSRIRDLTSDRGQKVPDKRFTYIDVTSIDKEVGAVAEPKVLDPNEAPSRARKVARKGDVIYSCVRPYLLNVAVLETEFDPEPIVSTAFAVLDGYGLVLPRYLWIALRSPFMVDCVEASQRGQAYPAINDSDFALLPLPLPPLAEQRRIVARVDELMALCDQLEAARKEREATRDRLTAASLARLNAPNTETFRDDARSTLDALPTLTARPDQIRHFRQTILDLAAYGKLVPQDPRDGLASDLLKQINAERQRRLALLQIRSPKHPPYLSAQDRLLSLPSTWTLCTLGELAIVIDPNPSHRYPDYVKGTVPILSTQEFEGLDGWSIGTAKLTTTEFWEFQSRICRFADGDIVFARKGRLGLPRFLPPFERFTFSHTIFLIKPIKVNPRYLLWLLRRDAAIRWLTTEMNQNTGVPTLGKAKTERLPIPLPPLHEQHRITAKIEELMALCDRLETSLTAGDETRRHLLDALLHEALGSKAAA